MKTEEKCETCCGCFCHNAAIKAAGITVFGLLFLFQGLNWLAPEIVAVAWPILVILAGLKMLCRCCQEDCGC